MPKRQSLTFEELEPRGRRAILRSAEEVAAEEAVLESQNTGIPENQKTRKPASQHTGDADKPSDGRTGRQPAAVRATYIKATYRLSPEALEAIDEAKRVLRRQYGIRVTMEEIAEEAILKALDDLVANQHASHLVTRFSGIPEIQ